MSGRYDMAANSDLRPRLPFSRLPCVRRRFPSRVRPCRRCSSWRCSSARAGSSIFWSRISKHSATPKWARWRESSTKDAGKHSSDHAHIDPIRSEAEGQPLELPRAIDAAEVKLTGKVQGSRRTRGASAPRLARDRALAYRAGRRAQSIGARAGRGRAVSARYVDRDRSRHDPLRGRVAHSTQSRGEGSRANRGARAFRSSWRAHGRSARAPAVVPLLRARERRSAGAAVGRGATLRRRRIRALARARRTGARSSRAPRAGLSHAGIDRRGPILPLGAPEDVEKISPVEASWRYLEHLAEA